MKLPTKDYSILFLTILVSFLFAGLISCFVAVWNTNINIYAQQTELAYLNRRLTNEKHQRRVLQDRIWGIEERHEIRLMKLSKQYDIWLAAKRGGWRVTEQMMREGMFDY